MHLAETWRSLQVATSRLVSVEVQNVFVAPFVTEPVHSNLQPVYINGDYMGYSLPLPSPSYATHDASLCSSVAAPPQCCSPAALEWDLNADASSAVALALPLPAMPRTGTSTVLVAVEVELVARAATSIGIPSCTHACSQLLLPRV